MSTQEPTPTDLTPPDPLALAARAHHLKQQQEESEAQNQRALARQPARLGAWQDTPRGSHRRHLHGLITLRRAGLLGPLGLSGESQRTTEAQAQGVWLRRGTPALLIPRQDAPPVLLTGQPGQVYQVTRTGRHRVNSAAELDLNADAPAMQPFTRPGFLTRPVSEFGTSLNAAWNPWTDGEGRDISFELGCGLLLSVIAGGMLGFSLSGMLSDALQLHLTVIGANIGAWMGVLIVLASFRFPRKYHQFRQNARQQQEHLTPLLLAPEQGTVPPADVPADGVTARSLPTPFDPRF